jgi:hypothetical protein
VAKMVAVAIELFFQYELECDLVLLASVSVWGTSIKCTVPLGGN